MALLEHGERHARAALPHLCELALGGTSLNAPKVDAEFPRLTGLPLITAPHEVMALANGEALIAVGPC